MWYNKVERANEYCVLLVLHRYELSASESRVVVRACDRLDRQARSEKPQATAPARTRAKSSMVGDVLAEDVSVMARQGEDERNRRALCDLRLRG